MAEVMANAATSVLGSVIGKLGAMLTEKYQLAKKVESGICFLRDELSTMDAVLRMLSEKDDDQIDPRAMDWRSKVRELSYDIEDCVDRFMLNHSQGGSKANFVRKAMRKVKTLFKDGGIAEEIQELKSLVSEQSERGKRYYDINQCLAASAQPVLLDPRAPALSQEASDLVGIDAPREEIIRLLKCEEKQHKVVSIYGIGGQGKTTLAMDVYHKITEAGLLANRSKTVEVWVNVLRSIAAAVDKDSPIDKMKRILLLSYFDLPHHLKSCLLYLSVFPEDYLIDCRQLILLWVAEGLIPGQDRESKEQLGRSYLNELINRSLVQPTKVGADGTTVKLCRVHDVILEFIVSKAVEDNFVTIWNGDGFSRNYSSNKIRRLSIQKDISAQVKEIAKTIKNAAHIRSISIFGSNSVLVAKHASEFLNSQVLRVLNIEGVHGDFNLGHVKSFGLLKYLRAGLNLPEDAEKLQHIETLVVSEACLKNLPTCIIHMQKLVRLHVDELVRLPDGIRNLQALEELSRINFGIQSVEFIQGLGDLTNLRVLGIDWPGFPKLRDMEGHNKACVSTLSRLFRHLRELRVFECDLDSTCSFMASCVPTPPPLQKLFLDTRNFNRVGPQISSLVNLSRLNIGVYGEAVKEGINILASLPMLLSLTVWLYNDKDEDSGILYPRHAISRQGFQLLVKFNLSCWCREAALEFEPGAMPKLQTLKLRLMARCQFKSGEGGLVLGLQNLGLGLKHVAVVVDCDAAVADEVEALEDNIRGAAAVHPNSPILQVERKNQHRLAHGCSRRPSDHAIVEA